MSSNLFFKKKKFTLRKIFPKINFKKDFVINEVKPLGSAQKNDLSFLDSVKYKEQANKTNAGVCITTENLQKLSESYSEKCSSRTR